MAASAPSRQLAREISELSAKSLSRIVRLAPRTASTYLKVIGRAGHDPEVVVAVERYLLAARRAEKHADAGTRKMFAAADTVLAKRLAAMAGDDVELLGRELAYRRVTVLGNPADLEAEVDAAARAVRVSRDLDVGAAMLQRGFFDRLRSVAALGPGQWTEAQRLLLQGRRKLLAVLGGEWAGGWEPTFLHLRNHAAKIADSARRVQTAEAALDQVRKGGSVTAVRAAQEELRNARQAVTGHMSKIKGLLGEGYVPRWRDWRLLMDGYIEVAEREARGLAGNWEVRRVVGDLRIDGAEAWDEAILLVSHDTNPSRAKLFLAGQYKVEKQVSALQQVQNDVLRETAVTSGRLPRVSFLENGVPQTFDLTPMPVGKTSHRYVFNAAGGRFSATDIDRLRSVGIEVNQLNLDVSVAEFDEVAHALIDVVADTVR